MRNPFFVIIILLAASNAMAQIASSPTTITTSSLHDIIDARSIALGESSVARPGSAGAWNSNPATLAGITGMGVEYGHRVASITFPSDYYTAGVWLGTPIGTFALHYNKFDQGEWQMTFENGTIGSRIHLYDRTLALSYATKLLTPISLGITVKDFAQITDLISGTSSGQGSSTNFYVDLGLLYSIPRKTDAHDSLRIGLAVQNIGGDYDSRFIINDSVWQTYRQPIAHWLRVGLAYDVTMLEDSSGPLLSGSVSAEYRRFLNPEAVNFLGGGLEATVYDLVMLRVGAVVEPENNIYGNKGTPAIRYGVGLNFPLRKIGVNVPWTFSFDYASVPLHTSTGSPASLGNLNVVGVKVAYTAPIFK